jgi:hypothetical protein
MDLACGINRWPFPVCGVFKVPFVVLDCHLAGLAGLVEKPVAQ